MQNDAVDAVARGMRHRRVQTQPAQNRLHRRVVAFVVQPFGRCLGAFPVRPVRKPVAQGASAVGLHRNGGNDRYADRLRQGLRVDLDPAALGQVDHVERYYAWQPEPLDGQHQAQVAPQVGGIDDADHQIRALLAGGPAVQHLACDALVRRSRVQAVGSGQVEHTKRLAVGRAQLTLLAFDRDAGVVGHFLAASSEQVEQRGLAAVRVADQGDQRSAAVDVDDRLAHRGSTSTQAASARRSAKVESPMRTTNGPSRHSPRAVTLTLSPGRKPISASHRSQSGAPRAARTAVTRQASPVAARSRVSRLSVSGARAGAATECAWLGRHGLGS